MPDELVVRVVRLDAALPLPAYARAGDAGVDLVAREDTTLAPAGGRAMVPTGIAIELADGWAGFVLPRSGLAARHGITCLNAPGLIDSGYRDEIKVVLVNLDPSAPYDVQRGDRIAQLVVQRVAAVRWEEVGELSASLRGRGGFGHSGR
jgi:dUTP pyrophosphatase